MRKVVSECPALRRAIEQGIVVKRDEDIDDKGVVTTYNIGDVAIKYCPWCGENIGFSMVPDGVCAVNDILLDQGEGVE